MGHRAEARTLATDFAARETYQTGANRAALDEQRRLGVVARVG